MMSELHNFWYYYIIHSKIFVIFFLQILAHNYRDVLLRLNVKNSKGQTFNDISSLKFDFKVSDESLLKQSSPSLSVNQIPVGDGKEFGTVSYPGRGNILL